MKSSTIFISTILFSAQREFTYLFSAQKSVDNCFWLLFNNGDCFSRRGFFSN